MEENVQIAVDKEASKAIFLRTMINAGVLIILRMSVEKDYGASKGSFNVNFRPDPSGSSAFRILEFLLKKIEGALQLYTPRSFEQDNVPGAQLTREPFSSLLGRFHELGLSSSTTRLFGQELRQTPDADHEIDLFFRSVPS